MIQNLKLYYCESSFNIRNEATITKPLDENITLTKIKIKVTLSVVKKYYN